MPGIALATGSTSGCVESDGIHAAVVINRLKRALKHFAAGSWHCASNRKTCRDALQQKGGLQSHRPAGRMPPLLGMHRSSKVSQQPSSWTSSGGSQQRVLVC
jgi:hypothetical protein